jgi:hypothetical protein
MRGAKRASMIGSAYAAGRLSIDEVAAALHLSITDAVATLEAQGFRRPADVVRLTDAERVERLSRIRNDRLARGGAARLDRCLVEREVAASQRLAGIDARAWLTRREG